jgi:1-deoxy-D-xylulose 5-phosphate reductoisomerase
MKPSVDECKVAMQNDEIDDNTLVRMFRACLEPIGLVASAIECNNERAVRLLIAEQFDFSNVDECECGFLHLAYEFASLRIVDMLLAAASEIQQRRPKRASVALCCLQLG